MSESIIKKYYDNLKAGKLLASSCKKCNGITFPPTTACEHCGCMDVSPSYLTGKGKLLYVTHSIAPAPNPRYSELAPYAYGHVQLDEGVFVQGIINGVDIAPESLEKIFLAGPVNVVADIIEVKDLSVLAFKISEV